MMVRSISALAVLLLVMAGGAAAPRSASAQWLGTGLPSSDPTVNLTSFDALGAPPAKAFDFDTFAQRLDLGPIGFGVSVNPRRPSLLHDQGPSSGLAASAFYGLGDTQLRTTEIGLDLRLRWPSGAEAAALSVVEPYVSLGPALFVGSHDDSPALARGANRDRPMALGMRGALGVMWRVTRDAELFGEYRLTQDRGAAGSKASGDLGGADLFYGFSLRF